MREYSHSLASGGRCLRRPCGGSFAASDDGPAAGGGRRRACSSSWDAAMGPRLGDPLQTIFLALGKKCNPGGGPGSSKNNGDKTTL